jgi:alpha/beta superfamily hydrolase
MANNPSLGTRWEAYRPSKGIWFWSCAASIVATIVIGFSWGGWVTGGTAMQMATDAGARASAQMAAADCIVRFKNGSEASAQLATLKKADSSYERTDLIKKEGWATMPGTKDPVEGAADICARNLMNTKTAG